MRVRVINSFIQFIETSVHYVPCIVVVTLYGQLDKFHQRQGMFAFPLAHKQAPDMGAGRKAEENKANEKAKDIDESNKHGCFTYIESVCTSYSDTGDKWHDYGMNKERRSTLDCQNIDTRDGLQINSYITPALLISDVNSLKSEVCAESPSIENLWKTIFADPSKWFDYRTTKKHNRFPDFKHRDTNEALWLNDTRTPYWVLTKLNDLQDEAFAPSPLKEELWNFLFADPSKWVDFRKIKKNNKHPDFKHKDTDEALWIQCAQTPEWVTPMLKNLLDEAFAASSTENLWKTFFASPSKWFDNRKIKKNSIQPDFVHKDTREALWIEDNQTPIWATLMLNDLPDEEFKLRLTKNLWKSLFSDPLKWVDYRKMKKNNKFPDFMRKDTAEGLWIEAIETPSWVKPMLKNLRSEEFAPSMLVENLWKALLEDPSKWFDNRKIKKRNNYSDFKHKDTGEVLWTGDKNTPPWVFSKLNDIPDEAFAPLQSKEDLWNNFFTDPSKWLDYRKIKKNNRKFPDFKHKNTREALWIYGRSTPAWVLPKLNNLQETAFAPYQLLKDLWKNLFDDPLEWLDNRKIKKSIKSPDFIHKDTREALWIDAKDTPAWVLHKLNGTRDEAFAFSPSLEDLWVSIFVDQSKWLDYRKCKKSINHPDFVHKDTSVALRIEDIKTPAWVTLMLNNLQNERFATFPSTESFWETLFSDPSKWHDDRKRKKNKKLPDFIHKSTRKALWIDDKRTPSWVLPKLTNLQDENFACREELLASYEAKWNAFFASPSKWFDYRTNKRNSNAPDFRHKDTREVLWIDNEFTPDWVVPALCRLGDGLV